MVGNCPHSSPTRSTSVTNILMSAQNLIFSNCICASFQNSTEIACSNDIIILASCAGNFLSNLFNFSTNVGNFPSVRQQGGASGDELSNVGVEGLVRRRDDL